MDGPQWLPLLLCSMREVQGLTVLTSHAQALPYACRYSGTTPTSIRVMYVPATGGPSGINPFNTVYGHHPGQDKTADRGMLVAQPTTDGYVILEVSDRQVECLLKCGTECEGHCT